MMNPRKTFDRRACLGSLLVLPLAARANTPSASPAQLVLAVSTHSPVRAISQKEAVALYTGRSRSLADGTPLTPLDQQRDGVTRAAFYEMLTGMDIARINSYWARLHFTGQVQPPLALGDDSSVLRRLRSDGAAIGYLSNDAADGSVRVVMRLP